jgi:hypothetical protein
MFSSVTFQFQKAETSTARYEQLTITKKNYTVYRTYQALNKMKINAKIYPTRFICSKELPFHVRNNEKQR